jgi:hypothetical protein
MKKLDVSSITDSARFPIKSGTLAFLQQAYGEALEGIIISLIGPTYNTTTMYVLSGCVNTGSGSNYTISGGYVFLNGEIYSVPSAGFSTTGTDVPVFVLFVGQFNINADPVTFTDNSVKNVHNIRQVFVQSGASGSGLADYSTRYVMSFVIPQQLNASGAGVSGVYPNLIFQGAGLQPLAVGRVHIGDIPESHVMTYNVVFITPLLTADYITMLSLISVGTDPGVDVYIQYCVIGSTITENGFTIQLREIDHSVQNIDIAYVVYPV